MNQQRKPCPYCGESIAATAKKCRFCGEWIETPADKLQSNAQSHPASPQPATSSDSPKKQNIPQPPTQAPVMPPPTQPKAETPVMPPPQPQTQFRGQQNNTTNNSYPQPNDFIEEKSYFQKYFKEPFFTQFADFGGYTSRKDYWMAILFYNIFSLGVIGLGLILMFGADFYVGGIIVLGLYYLFTLIPSLALTLRRLRDGGKNPWSILLSFIPFLGPLILLLFLCRPSQYEYPQENISLSSSDLFFLGGCAVSLIVGICLLTSAGGAIYNDHDNDDDFYSTFYNETDSYPEYEIVEEVEYVVEDTLSDYYYDPY